MVACTYANGTIGVAKGNFMNLAISTGIHAAVAKELTDNLLLPGSGPSYKFLISLVADLTLSPPTAEAAAKQRNRNTATRQTRSEGGYIWVKDLGKSVHHPLRPYDKRFESLSQFPSPGKMDKDLEDTVDTLQAVHRFGSTFTVACIDLLPGECCAQPHIPVATQLAYENLQAGDIAALWRRRRTPDGSFISGCSGQAMFTHAWSSPGTWRYQWVHGPLALEAPSGASYIRLPPRLPPDQTKSNWLSVEGMRALAWGGGKWFAATSTSSSGPYRRTPIRQPGPPISHNRGVFRGGTFYATAPPKLRFPDRASINGSQYIAETGTDGLIYRGADGTRLNFTTVAD
ncbi:MAG: hypothetical protein Q9218_004026 [Villophora microphyllina]